MNNDTNGTALAALAAALAPYLVTELAKVSSGSNGNPTSQQGGGFGAQQNTGAQFDNSGGQGAAQAFGAVGGLATAPTGQQNMFGGSQSTQQQNNPTVTPDMIQTLITPLVQNEQIKQALTAQMQQMGIQNLPDARPEQLAELYSRFQTVQQQAQAAGLIGGAAQGGGTPSII